jgi:hypothetical protein
MVLVFNSTQLASTHGNPNIIGFALLNGGRQHGLGWVIRPFSLISAPLSHETPHLIIV